MTRDTDLDPIYVACHKEPSKKDKNHISCAPETYVSPLAWDGIDNSIFRPLSRVFAVDPPGEAVNPNALDEVADSAWFNNRRLSREAMLRGACEPKQMLDPPKDGEWLVDEGKGNGSSPGFRINIPGKGKYLLKADGADEGAERSTAASVIGAAIYNAVGFNTSCEQIVYFKRSALKLKPGLTASDNTGVVTKFDEAALDKVLKTASKRGDLIRMQASAWLPGHLIGPFRYEGVRKDDANDIIAHQERRELRGGRVLAAWIDHFDAREQNSMDSWIAQNPKVDDSSPGYVRHYYLDMSDCLGSEWAWDGISRRLGYSYLLDWEDIGADFISLGIPWRTWDHIERTPGRAKFGYFDVAHFVPEDWKNEYPNPAFGRMSERDGAWMARILAQFTPEDVAALSKLGQFTDPGDTEFLTNTLEGRLQKILARYLTKLSSLAQVHVDGSLLCATDLAEQRHVRPPDEFSYEAKLAGNSLRLAEKRGSEVCFALPPSVQGRYVLVTISDGVAAGPLVISLYDRGAAGWLVAGLERR